MIIYTFDHNGNEYAFTSLRKAIKGRNELFTKDQAPEIMRVKVVQPITKTVVCNLLMRRDYAVSMEDIA